MTDERLSEMIALIRLQFILQHRAQDWGEQTQAWFEACLTPLEDTLGKRAVEEHLTTFQEDERMPFLPVPSRILKIYCRLASPVPTADDAWAEVQEYIDAYGRNGARHPDAPHRYPWIRAEGGPRFSHPCIDRAIQMIGWCALCTGELQFEEGISKRWQRVYGIWAERWQERVRQEILRLGALPHRLRARPAYVPGAALRSLRPTAQRPRIASRSEENEALTPLSAILGDAARSLRIEKARAEGSERAKPDSRGHGSERAKPDSRGQGEGPCS